MNQCCKKCAKSQQFANVRIPTCVNANCSCHQPQTGGEEQIHIGCLCHAHADCDPKKCKDAPKVHPHHPLQSARIKDWESRNAPKGEPLAKDDVEKVIKKLNENNVEPYVLPKGEPMKWEELRNSFHDTYNGGHHEDAPRKAFHHGMDTVFNGLLDHVKYFLTSARKEERQNLVEMIEGMEIGEDKDKERKLEESLPGGWGCCGEEIIGYNQALSDLKARLKQQNITDKEL